MHAQRCIDFAIIKRCGKIIDFTIRWCRQSAAITSTSYRVQFQDELYDILSVDHMNFKRKGIKLHCRKVRR